VPKLLAIERLRNPKRFFLIRGQTVRVGPSRTARLARILRFANDILILRMANQPNGTARFEYQSQSKRWRDQSGQLTPIYIFPGQ
jgi:hypothetical protein